MQPQRPGLRARGLHWFSMAAAPSSSAAMLSPCKQRQRAACSQRAGHAQTASRHAGSRSAAAAAAARQPPEPATAKSNSNPNFTERPWFRELHAAGASAPDAAPHGGVTLFRFWHDEKRFKGTGETSLAQRALLAAGGRRTGGNVKSAAAAGPLGWQRKDDWDLLWSPSTTAHKAFLGGLRAGQAVSAMPGTQSICKKKRLAETLKQAYGEEGAFNIVPRTYALPGEVTAWRACMHAQAKQRAEQRRGGQPSAAAPGDAASGQQQQLTGSHGLPVPPGSQQGAAHAPAAPVAPRGLWMLKTAQHLGKGLRLVPYNRAVSAMLVQHERAEAAKRAAGGAGKQLPASAARPFVVAQQYIEDPLLINSRKFGIRVWALVTCTDPLRVYLHERGLVLFSDEPFAGNEGAGEDGEDPGGVAGGHVTNYAQNRDGDVWDLEQLRAHLGEDGYQRVHQGILRSTARVYSAALGPMRRELSRLTAPSPSSSADADADAPPPLSPPAPCAFELMGLDFLVDTSLHPWLLEVNSTPSLAVEHADPQIERRIYEAKDAMVRDMFSLLQVPGRFLAGGGQAAGTAALKRPVRRPLKAGAGGEAAGAKAAAVAATTERLTAERRAHVAAARQAVAEHLSTLLKEIERDGDPDEEALAWLTESELELRSRGGFLPLMPLFPLDERIEWSERDFELWGWCDDREQSRS